MSRSYKKHPFYTDGKTPGPKISKRYANKKVRNYKNKIAKGKSYKKLFCSYEIHDFIARWTWEDAKAAYLIEDSPGKYSYKDSFPTLKDFYRYWLKHHKIK